MTAKAFPNKTKMKLHQSLFYQFTKTFTSSGLGRLVWSSFTSWQHYQFHKCTVLPVPGLVVPGANITVVNTP